MLAAIETANLLGTSGQRVTVEVHIGPGIPSFTIVGLPDESCREARDRVRAALLSSGVSWPKTRITVNLAPAGLRKSGVGLDLPLAVGILVAADLVTPAAVEGLAFVGELGLDGSLRPIVGAAPMVASLDGFNVVVPRANVAEAAVAATGAVHSVSNLVELMGVLAGQDGWPPLPAFDQFDHTPVIADLADVRGQPVAAQALEIAAAGRHHLFFVGAPGSGKTMLAQRLPGLLPPLSRQQSLEATMIHSAAGRLVGGRQALVSFAPFRAPHHTASLIAMVGGGSAAMRPGEISLAHCGVLFLDELGEFGAHVLDGLRQPLEERVVRISRANAHVEMPADFLLVAATNPCPCGGGRGAGGCDCSEHARARYLRRLSGPLLDRFDLRVTVNRPGVDALMETSPASDHQTAAVVQRVLRARALATDRGCGLNGELPVSALDDAAPLTASARRLLRGELERGRLSGRGLHRIRRVARTIADLADIGDLVSEQAVHEALMMRSPIDHPRVEVAV